MRIKIFFIVLIITSAADVHAQGWTLRQVLDSALQNNLGIRIARNNAVIAANNVSVGSAGMLPVAGINAGASTASNDIRQQLRTGEVIESDGVTSTNTNASADLNWTIFDGFRMFAAYDRLKLLRDIGEVQVKQEVTAVLAAASQSYYDLQRQQMLVRYSQGTLALYDERMRISQKKLEIGSSPRTEFLQASLDYNAQLSLLTTRLANLHTAQAELNRILLRAVDDSITAADSLTPADQLNYGQLQTQLESGNLDLQQQLLLQEVADAELREVRSGVFPSLDLNAAYTYNNSTTGQGLLLENRSIGPSVGLTFRWNLFSGLVTQRTIKNYRLARENASLTTQQVIDDARAQLLKSWIAYQSSQEIYNRELQNETLAAQNLAIAGERYRLNEGTVLELREAQKTSEDAQSRLADAYYQVRIAATALLQLTGKLF